MKKRPVIKLQLTKFDLTLEVVSWFSILFIWGMTFAYYNNLPEIIPVHYNIWGEANRFGNKLNIFILPFISTILFTGMTILNKYPHIFNYPITITEENALKQYTNATRMIRYLKFIIVFIFGLILFLTIQNAHGQNEGLGIWLLPMILGLIFIPLTYYFVKSKKKKSIN